jgi:hypothetical protein
MVAKNEGKIKAILARPYVRRLLPDEQLGGYTAYIHEFPGCVAEGDTADEAIAAASRCASRAACMVTWPSWRNYKAVVSISC